MQPSDNTNSTCKPSTIRLVYWESLIALRSSGARIALAVFSILLLIAIALGVMRTQARQRVAESIEAENRQVKQLFEDILKGRTEGNEFDGSNDGRFSRLRKQLRMTARSPYMVSHAKNLWDISLRPSPLSMLSVGASQAWPDRYRVRGTSYSETLRRSEQIRPAASIYGPFDVIFMLMAIAPLVVIGLTFDVSSRDRESGLQNLVIAQASSLGSLMALRCLVRASLVIGLVISLVNGALLLTFGSQFDLNTILNLTIWNIGALLYLLIWAAISLLVNSFAKSSAFNGAALLLLWFILILLIPAVVSSTVQETVPTLGEGELVDRETSSFDKASKHTDSLVERFQTQHPKLEIDPDDEQQMTLVKYLLAHNAAGKKAAENVYAHYSAQTLRAKYLNACDWISPAISLRNQSDRCSGNSEPAFVAYAAYAANVQAQVMEVFLLPSIANEQTTMDTMAELPKFQQADIPKRFSLLQSIQSIAAMLVWLVVLTCFATRQFRVSTLNKTQKRLPQNSGVKSA